MEDFLPYIIGANGLLVALGGVVLRWLTVVARRLKEAHETVVIAVLSPDWVLAAGHPVYRDLVQAMASGARVVVLFRRTWTERSLRKNNVDYIVYERGMADKLCADFVTVVDQEIALRMLRDDYREDGAEKGGPVTHHLDHAQRVLGLIGEFGCYFLSVVWIAQQWVDEQLDILAVYTLAVEDGCMERDCTMVNASRLLHLLGVPWATGERVIFASAGSAPTDDTYYVQKWSAGNHDHFVVAQKGKVVYDPLGASNTVATGTLDSIRLFK